MEEVVKRGYCYFLSSRSYGEGTREAAKEFAEEMDPYNKAYSPFNMGVLLSVYVSESDVQAKNEAEKPI